MCELKPHLHQCIDEHRYSVIGKHLKNDHFLGTIRDLTYNFSVLKKCNGKLDCLIYEMIFIKKKRTCLNTQSDSYAQNYLFNSCDFLRAYFTFYRLARYISSCQILFSFQSKMMTWSHRKALCKTSFAYFHH